MKQNIYEKVNLLKHYYDTNRRRGHTRLMKEGTKNYKEPFFIIAPMTNYNGEMECKPDNIISWNNLKKLYGSTRPIIFDNSTMSIMFNEIYEHIQDLENENDRLKRTLKSYIGS